MTDVQDLTQTGTTRFGYVRPQPLGVLPEPAGWLVVPDVEGAEELCAALLAGRVPTRWSGALAFIGAAADGRFDEARALLAAARPLIDADVADVDAFVLGPTADAYRSLAGRDLTPELRVVVDAAAFAAGLVDRPPSDRAVAGEFAVLALVVQGAALIEDGRGEAAASVLRTAVDVAEPVSPVLAAVVTASLADTLHLLRGPVEEVVDVLDRAVAALAGTDLEVVRASLSLQRGVVTHEMAGERRALLMEAIRHYQRALQVFDRETHPEPFAFAHTNLALAYLTIPMHEAGDQLRMGVAVQSLRAALDVYGRTTHPERWASTQLNLANALVHLPSNHRQQNLEEAVVCYEAVLSVRDARIDPLGTARVLANQGTALAHLGIFEHALPKLAEARRLFEQCGDRDAVATVDGQLDQIARRVSGKADGGAR